MKIPKSLFENQDIKSGYLRQQSIPIHQKFAYNRIQNNGKLNGQKDNTNANTKKINEIKETVTTKNKINIVNKISDSVNVAEISTDNSTYSDETDSSNFYTTSNSSKNFNYNKKNGSVRLIKTNNLNNQLINGQNKYTGRLRDDYKKSLDKDKQFRDTINGRKNKNRLSICISQTRYKIIGKVAKSLGWKLVRYAGQWNVLWVDSDPGIEIYKDMKRYQKVNHFPGIQEICRKDLLARNLGRLLKIYPNEYDFYPKTWCFPADYMEAINYNREHKNQTFILKPDAGAQGHGIFLTKNIKECVKPTERLICQVYISRPLLIDGYKFDLRVYTLITTVDPLRIFVYNEGLVRMATSKYREPNELNISDLYMHLTNYSVNKHNNNYSHDAKYGSKRKFSSLHRNLIKEGYNIDTLWQNIDDTIIKTILSSWPTLKHNYRACFPCHDVMQACFEILGFDILVDRNLKPYILEVNQSPSFYTNESIDYEIKEALIKDTLNLLNISLIDKTKIMNEDKKRIKMRLLMTRKRSKSALSKDELSNTSSPLGQQIAWEECHLGGFRRIMPAHFDTHRYLHLIQLQNQSSIYSETAASKRREEAAKQMRIKILEKQKRNQAILLASKTLRNRIGTGSAYKKHKTVSSIEKEWYSGCVISDLEERERKKLLIERGDILQQNGILKMILEEFNKMKILSESDIMKYGDHIKWLEKEQNRSNIQNVIEFSESAAKYSTGKNNLKNNNNTNKFQNDEQILSLPLVTLKLQQNYKNQLNKFLKVPKIKTTIHKNVIKSGFREIPPTTDTIFQEKISNQNYVLNPSTKRKCAELLNNLVQVPVWKYYNI